VCLVEVHDDVDRGLDGADDDVDHAFGVLQLQGSR